MTYRRTLLALAVTAALCAPSLVLGEDNKAIARRFIEEVLTKGNMAAMDELVAPDFVGHNPTMSEVKGIEDLKKRVTMTRTTFPDIRYTIEDMVAEGDKVATRLTVRGTHKGEYRGVAPTGKQVTWTAINIARYADGKMQEGWVSPDTLGLMQQLGAVPKPGQAGK
jgi:steroid delta-isomerase-like uncharacterized protein